MANLHFSIDGQRGPFLPEAHLLEATSNARVDILGLNKRVFVGQIFALFVLAIAAAEAAIGLAIIVVYFRNRGSIAVEDVNLMKG